MGLPHGTGGAMVAIIHYKRLWLENKLDGANKNGGGRVSRPRVDRERSRSGAG
jgi:hypothetical protein